MVPFIDETSNNVENQDLQRAAIFLANLFYLRSHAYTPVISLNTLDDSSLLDRNIILIGTEFCTSKMRIQNSDCSVKRISNYW